LKNRPICGGDSVIASSGKNPKNLDTCIAVAGLPANNTLSIRKYCVPKAQGKGVRSALTETWFVWYRCVEKCTLLECKKPNHAFLF
jgi:hypothetical protein